MILFVIPANWNFFSNKCYASVIKFAISFNQSACLPAILALHEFRTKGSCISPINEARPKVTFYRRVALDRSHVLSMLETSLRTLLKFLLLYLFVPSFSHAYLVISVSPFTLSILVPFFLLFISFTI